MDTNEIEKLIKAGEIIKQVKLFAQAIVKPNIPLLELSEKIEGKIIELGARPAFPVNLSSNEIAAHATPAFNDTEIAKGLLKVDLGAHIDGFASDTALSFDLENSKENMLLIEAAQAALDSALKIVQCGVFLKEIGSVIEATILEKGAEPIRNLSGHSIEPYNLHAGITIPNHDNSQDIPLEEGLYAIEPFTTSGAGAVINGKPSGIYQLEGQGNVRDPFAREVLVFIKEEYRTLPFCSRWLVKKFGTRALIALKRIEEAGLVHHHPQLIERDRKPVAQAEHTVIVLKDKVIVTT